MRASGVQILLGPKQKDSHVNNDLYTQIQALGLEVAHYNIDKFPDGELQIMAPKHIASEILILPSIYYPINDFMMEIFLLASALGQSGTKKIHLILPYMPYNRQDKDRHLNGYSSRIGLSTIWDMLAAVGISDIVTLDLHNTQSAEKSKANVHNFSSLPAFLPSILKDINHQTLAIVAPDKGGFLRAANYSDTLACPLILLGKARAAESGNVQSIELIEGDIMGKSCLIIDDIVASGGTLVKVAQFLQERGATSIDAVVTHGILCDDGMSKLEASALRRIYLSDSLPIKNLGAKACQISIMPILLNYIKSVFTK